MSGIRIYNAFSGGQKVPVPTGISLDVISDTQINVNYTSTYNVEVWISTNNVDFTKHGDSPVSPYSVTGLTPDTLYYIKIRGVNSGEYSDFTNSQSAGIVDLVIPNNISTIQDSQVHPSIVYFPNSWKGYKYWLAITPFPGDPEELPCLYVSNNLTDWTLPNGASNPLFGLTATNRPRDPYLFYDAANDRLIFYIGTNAGTKGNWYSYTSDGVNWSALTHITIDGSNASGVGQASQCIIKDGNDYIMWDIEINATPSLNPTMRQYTSSDGFVFTTVGTCTFDIPYTVWHFEVFKELNTYYMLAVTTHASNPGGVELYLFSSADKLDWNSTTDYPVLDQYKSNQRYYKCTTFKENGKYTLITNEWDGNYANKFKLNLYRNINLPFSLKPNINLSYTPTLPYLVGDDFIRANSNTSLGTSKSGSDWTNLIQAVGISGNKAYAVHATTPCYATVDCGVADNIIIEGRFLTTPQPNMNTGGIVFRVQDATHYFVATCNAAVGYPFSGFLLKKRDGGVEVTVLTIIANRFKDGDIIGVKLVGNVFTFYRNNAIVGTYTDSSFNTETKHGLKLVNTNTNTVNGFCNYFSIRNI